LTYLVATNQLPFIIPADFVVGRIMGRARLGVKPMTLPEARRWRLIQARGRSRYVLKLGGFWWLWMLSWATLFAEGSTRFAWSSVLGRAVWWGAFAFLWARWLWSRQEARFGDFIATLGASPEAVLTEQANADSRS